ncbi:DUF192 domain-containing protein [Parvibaculum sp. MBR-TMA-1.3b-4.2]|jgi:uncharacterized membrane protein (UPF0127 family)
MRRLVLLAALLSVSLPSCAMAAEAQAGSEGLRPLAIAGQGGRHDFQVEIADDNAERLRGLQGRETLPRGQGMLFIYEGCRRVSFWMKDTPVSLDIAFLDRNGDILDIAAGTEPYSLAGIGPDRDVFAVLEVGAGELAARDISAGDRVLYPALEGPACE